MLFFVFTGNLALLKVKILFENSTFQDPTSLQFGKLYYKDL